MYPPSPTLKAPQQGGSKNPRCDAHPKGLLRSASMRSPEGLRMRREPGRPGGREGVHRVPPLYSITLKGCSTQRTGPTRRPGLSVYMHVYCAK
jgi:hypothetical protein